MILFLPLEFYETDCHSVAIKQYALKNNHILHNNPMFKLLQALKPNTINHLFGESKQMQECWQLILHVPFL
jgi:hypothetical protein